jgi:hypothetical protein
MIVAPRRSVLLVQLPIPPLGPDPIRGNVPLAAAYLKRFAENRGLGDFYAIDVLPATLANTLGDRALVAELVRRERRWRRTNVPYQPERQRRARLTRRWCTRLVKEIPPKRRLPDVAYSP